MRAEFICQYLSNKGIYADELVTDKKDAKFIGKDASEILANSVENPLYQCTECVIYM